MTKIFYCFDLFDEIKKEVKQEVDDFVKFNKRSPTLAVIKIGDDKASEIYVKRKQKACEEVGILMRLFTLDHFVEELVETLIKQLNEDYDSVFIQLPIPGCETNKCFKLLNLINIDIDVDGFCVDNMGLLNYKIEKFVPCAPLAVQYIIQNENIPIIGKHVVIINDTIVVGRPLASLLLNMGATVTICNDKTENLKDIVMMGDIIVTAVGRRDKFTLNFCKKNAVIFDVGISKIEDKVVGDVDLKEVDGIASMVTAVPGGIGILTMGMLLKNVVLAARLNSGFGQA